LRGELARCEAHDGALARAVGAEEGHPFAAFQDEVEVFQEGFVGVGVGVAHALHLQHDTSGPHGRSAEVEFDVLCGSPGAFYLLHPVEELLLAPGLAGFSCLGPVLLDEALELGPALGVGLGFAR
jgi:hypothetical protein